MEIRPKTVFCDIDGTLIEHAVPWESSLPSFKMKILPNTLEKLAEWDRKGYNIILTTGRRESLRKVTEQQLSEVGIFYDQLIMGIGSGTRILINDTKPNGDITAVAINLNRNQGIQQIEI
jgi:FMN phosphatase YigB (HAD superfamily)